MKKRQMIIVFLLALSMCFSSTAYALAYDYERVDNLNTEQDLKITPLWTYILDVWQTFDINSSGRAEIVATMDAKSENTDSLTITSNLQQLKNGSWTTIKSWTSSTESISLMHQENWYVSKGHSYRLVTNYYAYSGGDIESTNLISRTLTY